MVGSRRVARWVSLLVLVSLVACFQSSPPEGNALDPVPDVSSREVISQSLALGSGVGEFGKVRVGQANRVDWHTVELFRSYEEPVVIMQPIGMAGADPAIVRLRNVASDSFEFQVQEWDYLDGGHTVEVVSFLVVEAGTHRLPDGRYLQAGVVGTANEDAVRVPFARPFPEPVILTQVQTAAGPSAVVTRQSVGPGSFTVVMQEEEASDGIHAWERIGYVVMASGSGTLASTGFQAGLVEGVTHAWSDIPFVTGDAPAALETQGTVEYLPDEPVFLAGLQTTFGQDTATLRYRNLTPEGVEVMVEEESSADGERQHAPETVGFVAFDVGFRLIESVPTESSVTILEQYAVGDAFEVGCLSAAQANGQDWLNLGYLQDYERPVVLFGPPSFNGGQPLSIRLRNISSSSTQFQLDEWDYLDGGHIAERVCFLIGEEGRHDLEGGVTIELGSAQVGSDDTRVPFRQPFPDAPVVIAQVQSLKDPTSVVDRVYNIAAGAFSARLQEQEQPSDGDPSHTPEKLGYAAFPVGSVSTNGIRLEVWQPESGVNSTFSSIGLPATLDLNAVWLADLQSLVGVDTASLRHQTPTTGPEARIEEESSGDTETTHATEDLGIFAFGPQAELAISGRIGRGGTEVASSVFEAGPQSKTSTVDAAAPNLAAVQESISRDGRARVIVRLDVAFRPEAELPNRASVRAQQARLAQAQARVLERIGIRGGVHVTMRPATVPLLGLVVDGPQLQALLALPDVAFIEEDSADPPNLAESGPLIGAEDASNAGGTGEGVAVAVLDTGVQSDHPFFAGSTIEEACYSSSFSDSTHACPNGADPDGDGSYEQVGPGSAAPCTADAGCDHGTHVAGIALGEGPSYSGVAKDADLIAVQVFSVFDAEACASYGYSGTCALSYRSDQIRALERVYALRDAYTIASINMSLGGGYETVACDDDSRKLIIDNLRAAGIATVASSGNSYYTDGMGRPACISSAISVGSTQDGSSGTTTDAVSEFSNSADFLDLLAPGESITSSIPTDAYGSKRGTSMAAPQVAGAWALLKQQNPNASVPEILATLSATGVPITDSRNNVTKARIQVDAALASAATLRVRLYEASSGAWVRETTADSNGDYQFSRVPPGTYFATGYEDLNGNGDQDAGEPAGAFGSVASPQPISASSSDVDFSTGFPTEREPNDFFTNADTLLFDTFIGGEIADGSIEGQLLNADDADYFIAPVPEPGIHTFETFGSCGSGDQVDTVLDLFDGTGAPLSSNDDGGAGLCSVLAYDFSEAGAYFVRVTGFGGDTGSYLLGFD